MADNLQFSIQSAIHKYMLTKSLHFDCVCWRNVEKFCCIYPMWQWRDNWYNISFECFEISIKKYLPFQKHYSTYMAILCHYLPLFLIEYVTYIVVLNHHLHFSSSFSMCFLHILTIHLLLLLMTHLVARTIVIIEENVYLHIQLLFSKS